MVGNSNPIFVLRHEGHIWIVDLSFSYLILPVLYLDPPYNDRDYAAYYHLPETLATARDPQPRGKSGIHAGARRKSAFSSPRTATDAMEDLLSGAQFTKLFLHYSDNGLISRDWLRQNLARYGRLDEHVITAAGYSSTGARNVTHRLYLVSS